MEIQIPIKGTPIRLFTELSASEKDTEIDVYYIGIILSADRISYNKSIKYKLNIDSETYNIIDLINSSNIIPLQDGEFKITNRELKCINKNISLYSYKLFDGIYEMFLNSKSIGDFKYKLTNLLLQTFENDILYIYNSIKVDYKKEFTLLDFYKQQNRYKNKPRKTEFWKLYFEAN